MKKWILQNSPKWVLFWKIIFFLEFWAFSKILLSGLWKLGFGLRMRMFFVHEFAYFLIKTHSNLSFGCLLKYPPKFVMASWVVSMTNCNQASRYVLCVQLSEVNMQPMIWFLYFWTFVKVRFFKRKYLLKSHDPEICKNCPHVFM